MSLVSLCTVDIYVNVKYIDIKYLYAKIIGVSKITKKVSHALLTAVAPITWGSTYLVTTEFLPPHRPLLTAALRALPVGLLLLALCRRLPSGIWWWRTLVLGALNFGLFFALLFVGAYRLPGGVAATVGAIGPLVAALLAWLLLSERPSPYGLAAALAGVAGVALIVLGPAARLDLPGVAAALGATVSMAAGAVLTKRWGRPAPLLVFTAWQLLAGGIILALLTLAIEGLPPALTFRNLAGYTYLGLIGTALAYTLWFRGIERLGPTATSFLGLLSPVMALLLGFVVLRQSLSLMQGAGVALVLASVFGGQAFNRGQARPGPRHGGALPCQVAEAPAR